MFLPLESRKSEKTENYIKNVRKRSGAGAGKCPENIKKHVKKMSEKCSPGHFSGTKTIFSHFSSKKTILLTFF